MQDYYNRRATEYEQIYRRDDPVRLTELADISAFMCDTLAGRDVLEVACGTGYWTARLAESARSIVATDASREMLEMARSKNLPPSVSLVQADAYDLTDVPGSFNAALANFWFSHVPRARIEAFLNGLHERLGAGARIFMADNCYQSGVGGELVLVQGSADTYKRRFLGDGSEHLVLKNYYNHEQLISTFEPHARNLQVHVGRCYWWLSYELA